MLNVTFSSFPDFASNAKPLYLYMQNRYKNKMNLVWIVNSEEMLEKLSEQNIKAYKYRSDEYYNYIKTSDIIFTTHCNLIDDKPENCIYVDLWHGIGMKPVGYLINNISEFDKEWYHNVSKKIDYMIEPSEFWQVLFSAMFRIQPHRILPIGYPKLDEMVEENCKERLNNVLNIKSEKYDKIILYGPTLSQNFDRKLEVPINTENVINLESYDEKNLKEYLEKNNYLLCVKFHPSEKNFKIKEDSKNIKYITEEKLQKSNTTITAILNAMDILISDYSSLAIEFNFLNRPVIFLNRNRETYIKNRGVLLGEPLFWESAYTATNIEKLIENINLAVVNGVDSYSKKIRKLWFGNLIDGGCDRICNFFFNEKNELNSNVERYHDIEDVLNDEIYTLKTELSMKENQLIEQKSIIDNQRQEINNIYNSKGWKLLEKMRKVKKIIGPRK